MTLSADRRLTRSRSDRMIFGVCGGLGEYFNVDPTLVRILVVLTTLVSGGIAIPAYYIMAFIVPEGPRRPIGIPMGGHLEGVEQRPAHNPTQPGLGDEPISTIDDDLAALAARKARKDNRQLAGFVLLGAGAIFLLSNFGFFWWFNWRQMWPLILIGIGLAMLLGRQRNRSDL